MVDEQRKIQEVNNTAIDRYGYSREALLSMRVEDLSSPELHGKVPKRICDSFTGSDQFKWRHQCRGGRGLDVEINSRPIDFGGMMKMLLASARDISARNQLEAQLRPALDGRER